MTNAQNTVKAKASKAKVAQAASEAPSALETFKATLKATFNARLLSEARKAACEAGVSVTETNAREVLATHNSSMYKTLQGIEKLSQNDFIVKVMLESGCNAAKLMQSEREGSYYSVYAYEKHLNIAQVLCKAGRLNHYTKALLLSLANLSDKLLNYDDMCCIYTLDKASSEVDASLAKFSLRKSSGTAKTQASSSANALADFAIITETRDARNRVAYKLNADSANAKALLSLASD